VPEPPPRRTPVPPEPGQGQPSPPPSRPTKKRRKPGQRTVGTYLFFAVIAVIAAFGLLQVTVGVFGDKTPAIGDHIHAALGVNICGEFEDNAPTFLQRAGSEESAGIHSHNDGLMHIHPEADDETGFHATVGKFFEEGGWELSEDRINLQDGWSDTDVTNGDTCFDGRPATVRWMVNGTEQDGNPADFAPDDGDRITIAFLPDGDTIPEPPADVLTTLASALRGQGND